MISTAHHNIGPKGAPPNLALVIDELVRRLTLSRFRFKSADDLKRFQKSLIADFKAYKAEEERLNSGQIGAAIGRLYKLTIQAESNRPEAHARLAKEISTLHHDVQEFLGSRRAKDIRIPASEEFLSIDRRHEAVQNLISVLRWGSRIATGRNRPSGKRSRSFVAVLWKPTPDGPGRKAKSAEEWFVTCLSITYIEATGRKPPFVVNYNSKSPFVQFVVDCFEAAGIDTAHSSAVRAINAVGSKKLAVLHDQQMQLD